MARCPTTATFLRSNAPDEVLSVEVLRFDTQEVLEGQLNGRVLEPSFSFAVAAEDAITDDSDTNGSAESATTTLASPTIRRPFSWKSRTQWIEVDGSPWTDEGTVIGNQLIAAPSIDGYSNTYTTPGVQMLASSWIGRKHYG